MQLDHLLYLLKVKCVPSPWWLYYCCIGIKVAMGLYVVVGLVFAIAFAGLIYRTVNSWRF